MDAKEILDRFSKSKFGATSDPIYERWVKWLHQNTTPVTRSYAYGYSDVPKMIVAFRYSTLEAKDNIRKETDRTAEDQFTAYINKLSTKIVQTAGDAWTTITSAEYNGTNNPWNKSILIVSGPELRQRWETSMIVNYSKYLLPFNQWPTRLLDQTFAGKKMANKTDLSKANTDRSQNSKVQDAIDSLFLGPVENIKDPYEYLSYQYILFPEEWNFCGKPYKKVPGTAFIGRICEINFEGWRAEGKDIKKKYALQTYTSGWGTYRERFFTLEEAFEFFKSRDPQRLKASLLTKIRKAEKESK